MQDKMMVLLGKQFLDTGYGGIDDGMFLLANIFRPAGLEEVCRPTISTYLGVDRRVLTP